MPTTYLLSIPLPDDHADLAEALVRSAACFLEAQGATATAAGVRASDLRVFVSHDDERP